MHFIPEENDDVIMIADLDNEASDNEASDTEDNESNTESDETSEGDNEASDNEESDGDTEASDNEVETELTDTIRFNEESDNELGGEFMGSTDTFEVESGDLFPYMTGILGALALSVLVRFIAY